MKIIVFMYGKHIPQLITIVLQYLCQYDFFHVTNIAVVLHYGNDRITN